MAIIYEKAKDFDSVINICGQAVNYYTSIGILSQANEFQDRQEKLLIKKSKLSKQILIIVMRHRKSPHPRINARIVGFTLLFKLSVFFVVLNCICLYFIQFHATFYFNYINYSDLLIFCCQNVATLFFLNTFTLFVLYSIHISIHLILHPP